jgi:hypothetical protein
VYDSATMNSVRNLDLPVGLAAVGDSVVGIAAVGDSAVGVVAAGDAAVGEPKLLPRPGAPSEVGIQNRC